MPISFSSSCPMSASTSSEICPETTTTKNWDVLTVFTCTKFNRNNSLKVTTDHQTCRRSVFEFSDLRHIGDKSSDGYSCERRRRLREKVNEWTAVIKPLICKCDDGEVWFRDEIHAGGRDNSAFQTLTLTYSLRCYRCKDQQPEKNKPTDWRFVRK